MSKPTFATTAVDAQRYVTGHDASGQSIFQHEGKMAFQGVPGHEHTKFYVPWDAPTFPTDNSGSADTGGVQIQEVDDAGNVTSVHPHNSDGSRCLVMHMAPHSSSPMHRTVSTDYDIIISGELELELDDGSVRKLKAGDVVVQRGTNHRWHNRTDEYVHFVAVLVAAKPLVVDGKELGDSSEP